MRDTRARLRITFAFLFCCAACVAWGESSKIEFRNLFWPMSFSIEILTDGSAKWHSGIDAGGSGRVCPESSEYNCLVLDGAWKFAVPRSLIERPRIGETWQFDDTSFELVELVWLHDAPDTSRSLVIRSTSPSGGISFNFSEAHGIQAVTYLIPSDDDMSEVEASVWINTAMLAKGE